MVIIDYGMGNIGSIQSMLKKIGVESIISSDLKEIEAADKLVLPGIGAFDRGMENLEKMQFIPLLHHKINEEKVPILGICLGMQLMTQKSEEGTKSGLGWVDAETRRFQFKQEQNLKVPHICWNRIKTEPQNREFAECLNLKDDDQFYFVHSYYVHSHDPTIVLTKTHYGLDFCSAFVKDNIIGVQFHPEKSHRFGMKLLTGFSNSLCYA